MSLREIFVFFSFFFFFFIFVASSTKPMFLLHPLCHRISVVRNKESKGFLCIYLFSFSSCDVGRLKHPWVQSLNWASIVSNGAEVMKGKNKIFFQSFLVVVFTFCIEMRCIGWHCYIPMLSRCKKKSATNRTAKRVMLVCPGQLTASMGYDLFLDGFSLFQRSGPPDQKPVFKTKKQRGHTNGTLRAWGSFKWSGSHDQNK